MVRSWTVRAVARIMFEYAFCPLVIFGSLLITICAREHNVDWVQMMFFTSLAPVVIITVVEQLHPYRREWNYDFSGNPRAGAKELAKDLLYLLIITRIHSWILPTVLPLLVPHARSIGKSLHLYGAMSGLPGAVRVGIILIVGEFFWYWGHRLQHWSPLFWRFHSTHHVPTKLNALKSARNHPVDMLFLTVIGYLPLVMLGARGKDLMWAALLQSVVNITSHANVPVRSGIFAWLFATPDYHRIHHSSDIAESKANYGCRLLIWDYIFGSFRSRARRADIVVGVEPVRPRTVKEELLDPFFRSVSGL
jgi:ornithine lipid hydroxylase